MYLDDIYGFNTKKNSALGFDYGEFTSQIYDFKNSGHLDYGEFTSQICDFNKSMLIPSNLDQGYGKFTYHICDFKKSMLDS